jgi:ATP-dependent exoDNAse (exonuclease V) alpha subunit
LDLIRKGSPKEAIDAYSLHDRVFMAKSGEETRRQLVMDWWESQSRGTGGVMIAARRSDVGDLNTRARELMTAAGRLDALSIEVAGHCFATGDRVMTLKNNRGLGVINGTKGEVTHVDPQRHEVTLRAEDGRSVTLPSDYLEAGHLTHSYAITGHKAQGMTAEEAFVLGDETLYKEWAYVAMSRGRSSNRLYVVAGIDPERDELGGQVEKIADPKEELVRSLGKSRAKHLAIDSLEAQDLGRNPEPIEMERSLEV